MASSTERAARRHLREKSAIDQAPRECALSLMARMSRPCKPDDLDRTAG